MAVDGGGQFAHPGPRVVHDQRGEPGRGGAFGARRVGEHGGGAEAGGLGDEVRAVEAGAREGGVQVPGPDGARVVGDARDLGGLRGCGDTQLTGEFREGCGGDLVRTGRSRICHGVALLGGLGLISVWHGGERTGRTARRAKRGPRRLWFPGSGVIVVTRWFLEARCSVRGQGLKVTGRAAGAAPVGGTWRLFRENSMTCLKTGPQI